jgi:Fe-Mn family superoxide dismutase
VNKRTFLKSVLLGVAGVYASGLAVKAARGRKKWDGIFRMPELAYSHNSLEPFADAETIRLHLQHHADCTEKLNEALRAANLTGKTGHDLLRNSSEYPEEIRNLTGCYINHKLYWRTLAPQNGKEPSFRIISRIVSDFGSFDAFKKEFGDAASSVYGQGWVWLIADKSGTLKITSTRNHDNPMMDIAQLKGFPLLCLDVWEHAFYKGKTNPKVDCTGSFWNVVNWEVVDKRYSSAAKINFRV